MLQRSHKYVHTVVICCPKYLISAFCPGFLCEEYPILRTHDFSANSNQRHNGTLYAAADGNVGKIWDAVSGEEVRQLMCIYCCV
jgi:hypothetical protein